MGFKSEEDVRKFKDWLQIQMSGMQRHVETSDLIDSECVGLCAWAIPQLVFLGQIWPKGREKNKYWVISGRELPTDHIEESLARTPRDAVRHFSLKWQLQSAKVAELGEKEASDGTTAGSTQWDRIAGELQSNAEALYALTERDDLWDPEKTAFEQLLPATGPEKLVS